MNDPLINIKNLVLYRSGHLILKNFSLSIDKGPPYAIMGESGSGKTSLLFALTCLLKPEKGTIEICHQDPFQLNSRERAELMGMVFQDYALFPHINVLENIIFAPVLHAKTKRKKMKTPIVNNARRLLSRLKIDKFETRYPHELSGGQKQRVAIARSMILNPQILFLDEPSAALDNHSSYELAQLLNELNNETQVLVVSHDLPFTKQFCTRGCVMSEGTLLKSGNLDHLKFTESSVQS